MKSMTSAIAFAVMCVIATPALSSASDQQVVERQQPLQHLIRTEVVYPQEKGELQISVASLFGDGGGSRTFALPPPSVTVRPRRAWEIGVGLPIGITAASKRVALAVLLSYER